MLMDNSGSTTPPLSGKDCPEGPFETDLEKLSDTPPHGRAPAASQQNTNNAVPIEISRILHGGVSFYQGGLMNEGTVTWYAFDIERRLFVAVLGSMDNRVHRIPAAEKLSANQLLRYSDAAGYKRAEFVTLAEATPVQVREFSCLANKLLASEAGSSPQLVPQDTIKKTFSLLHGGKSLDLSEGIKRSGIIGELERFIKQPLQELILQTY